jgi:hypothetical protein
MTKKKSNLGLFVFLFFMILIVEAVMDIVLAPADEVLIPADVIGDAALLAIMVMGALMSR